jgi:hypothetical protein
MKRTARVILRATGTLAAVPAVLAGLSLHALVGAVVIVLIVMATLCWTIADTDRSQRLAMLISACRGNSRQPPSLLKRPPRPARGQSVGKASETPPTARRPRTPGS